MRNTLVSFAVPAFFVAALLALAPLAFAQNGMAPYNGDSNQPTYGDDARWSDPTTQNNDEPPYLTYGDDTPDQPTQNDQPLYPTYGDDARWSCAMDAMQCPDGSYVGRSGPNCQFVCPSGNTNYNNYNDDGSVNTVVVGADGSVATDNNGGYTYTTGDAGYPGGCGENGMLCPEFNNGGNSNWSNWSDPCYFANWIWINPCNTDDNVWVVGTDNNNGGNDGGNVQAVNFSASPTYGSAPLAVSFSASGLSSGSQYIIDFGDGQNSGPIPGSDPSCPPNPNMGAPCTIGGSLSAKHTYATNGTYTAILEPYAACLWREPRCEMAVQSLGSVMIIVGDGVNGGGTIMPDPTHGYGKNGFPNGGDTDYNGGPTDVTTVNADGSVNAQTPGANTSFSAFLQNLFSLWGF